MVSQSVGSMIIYLSGTQRMGVFICNRRFTLRRNAFAEVVWTLNDARQRSLTFKPATAFKSAYESLVWIHLVQTLMGENSRFAGDTWSGGMRKPSGTGCSWWSGWKLATDSCFS